MFLFLFFTYNIFNSKLRTIYHVSHDPRSLVAAITDAFQSKESSRPGQVPVIALVFFFFFLSVLIIYFLLLAADAINGSTLAGLLHITQKDQDFTFEQLDCVFVKSSATKLFSLLCLIRPPVRWKLSGAMLGTV